MLSPLVILILFVGAAKSFSSYQPFSPIQQLSEMENNLDPLELSNRKALQSNKILECDMEDVFETVGFNELQDLIEAVALRKGISPYTVLRMLFKRMKNKEEMEENLMNAIDGAPLPDLLGPPIMEVPPPVRIPPASSRAPYSLSANLPINTAVEEDTKVVIIPVAPPVPAQNSFAHRLPPVMKTDRHEGPFIVSNSGPPVGKINHMLPAVFPMLSPHKSNHLRPPLGATVQVKSGDPRNPINRDIIITVSPLMTLIEALRQAEIKYQNVLGLNHDMDVITFTHSTEFDCYLVNGINDVVKSEDSGWKITIEDRDGNVVYDNFCLPNGQDVLVKPGTIISLSYGRL